MTEQMFDVDWHFHPGGFFGTKNKDADLGRILAVAEARQLNGIALTSCHDRRWDFYRGQAASLPDFKSEDSRRIFQVSRHGRLFYFFDGQEIKGSDGDLNIICPGKVMDYPPKRLCVEELASIAYDRGAIVNLPHAHGLDGMAENPGGEEKIRDLIRKGLINNFEIFDSLNTWSGNRKTAHLYTELVNEGVINLGRVHPVSVSDGHRDIDLGMALTRYSLEDVNLENVFYKLRTTPVHWNGGNHIGKAGKLVYLGALALTKAGLRK